MQRIMIVDDEPYILTALMRAINNPGDIEIDIYDDVNKALKRAQTLNYDLYITDYRMPEMNGVDFLCKVKQLQPGAMRIILSGHADIKALLGAINDANIFRFITKPWDDEELNKSVSQALEYRKIMVENKYLADQVRAQNVELSKQKSELERIEEQYPGLTKVNWADDGSIILSPEDEVD